MVLENACVLVAVEEAERKLGRGTGNFQKMTIAAIIREHGTFPGKELWKLEVLLEELRIKDIFLKQGTYNVKRGDPIIVCRPTGETEPDGSPSGHTTFEFADRKLLMSEVAWMIVLER